MPNRKRESGEDLLRQKSKRQRLYVCPHLYLDHVLIDCRKLPKRTGRRRERDGDGDEGFQPLKRHKVYVLSCILITSN